MTFVKKLTDCPPVPQTNVQMAKSPILMKLGWVNPLMGGVDPAQYFRPWATLMGGAGTP